MNSEWFGFFLVIVFVAIVIYNRLSGSNKRQASYRKRRYRSKETTLEKISNRTTFSQKLALQKIFDGETTHVEDLSPSGLEDLAARVFSLLDYRNVKHTGGSNDGGVDVWMLNKQGQVEIVQCKQKAKRVSRPELIAFAKSMKQHHAQKGHYWAPKGFTQPAIDYASERNIKLYESADIRRLVLNTVSKI
mgnify:CR=1 FL=1